MKNKYIVMNPKQQVSILKLYVYKIWIFNIKAETLTLK